MSKYDIAAIRNKLKAKSGSKFKDPNEFRPTQPKDGETFKYRFFVLPPLQAGDTCVEGKASRDMDMFYVPNGSHWINNRPYPCPRVHDEETCPLCDLAFDLMNEVGDDKKKKSEIAKTYLPRGQHGMNIYFLNSEVNHEDLRGKVKWYNPSKQVYDIMEKCLYAEDQGDQVDPQAFGVFYDEEAAYVFQLECAKDAGYVSYKTSKFLAAAGKRPIAAKKVDGEIVAVPDKITELLDLRYDVYTKFETRNVADLDGVVNRILNKDDSNDAGFDVDEVEVVATSKPVSQDIAGEEPVTEDVEEVPSETKMAASDDDVTEDELEDLLGEIDG
jgi:hypothetical protein